MDVLELEDLTVADKMEMSLDQIIWYEEMVRKLRQSRNQDTSTDRLNKNMFDRTKLRESRNQDTSTDRLNKNMFDRTKIRRRHTISCDRPRYGDYHHYQKQLQCMHGRPFGFFNRNRQLPLYRKSVQKAVRTLRSKMRQNFRQRPYNTTHRMGEANKIMVSIDNEFHDSMIMNEDGAVSAPDTVDEMFGEYDTSVSFKNNFRQSNFMIDAINSDGSENLEMPVMNNLDFDFRKVPKFLFMGTKVVVSRHSFKNKLNHLIQAELKDIYETKDNREKYHSDMNVLVAQNTTAMCLNDRFTFNG